MSHNDFICDFSRFSSCIEEIFYYLDKIEMGEAHIVEALNPHTKKCDYLVSFVNDINIDKKMLDINSFFNIYALIDPETATSQRAYYLEKMNVLYTDEQIEAIQLLNRQRQQENQSKGILTKAQKKRQKQKMAREGKKHQKAKSVSATTATTTTVAEPVVVKTTSVTTPEKKAPKNPKKNSDNSQVVVKKAIPHVAPQQPIQVQPTVSYEVAELPFSHLFGNNESRTLQGILRCERNIDWKDFEALITSQKGFNGSIKKNKGGSYCVVSFNHPMTQQHVQFLVHKPHKSGKGGSKLYLDLMTRIKHHLEKHGVLNLN